MYCTFRSYGCNLSSILCNRSGARWICFLKIISSGLWSDSTIVLFPRMYSETRLLRTRLSTYTRLERSLRRSRTSPIGKHVHFFRIRRTERGTKSDITHQFSLHQHFFALSLALFSDYEHVFHCLSVLISASRHVFKFTMPRKAISPYEKRVMNDIQNGEASSVADRSREHVEPVIPVSKMACWIERTLVTTYLFSFPLRVRNNRVSLYCLNLSHA